VNHLSRKQYRAAGENRRLGRSLLLACTTLLLSGVAMAQQQTSQDTQPDVVSFKLAIVPQFADCLRANSDEEPRVRGTVIRGKQNDTLILDMDGIKPNLTLSVFSNERTFFGPDGLKDPEFHGFGLSMVSDFPGISQTSVQESTAMTGTCGFRPFCWTRPLGLIQT